MYNVLKPYGTSEGLKAVLDGMPVDVAGISVTPAPQDELREKLAVCDILIADVDISVDRALISQAPNLKAVLCTSIGVDYVDESALSESGIILANNPDFCVTAVAEFAIGLIYSLLRRIPAGAEAIKANSWETRNRLGGYELQGRTLGLVAFGRIGRDVARQALGIGMNVIAYDPYINEDAAKGMGVQPVSLEELLRTADIVSLHTPLTDSTERLIGTAEFEMMKDGSFLINAARGGVVDEQALLKAIKTGKLAGAALDVLENEPPRPGDPLSALMEGENVIITPHIAWHSYDASNKALNRVSEQIASLLRGEFPRDCLNIEKAKLFQL
jgi:D-3-phosphoglycerate dehydrogenase